MARRRFLAGAALLVTGLWQPVGAPAATAASTWAPVDEATIHPGVQTVTDGAQCTANFVFTDATDVYLGQAAHCAGTGAATETDGCMAGSLPLGTRVDVDGAQYPGELAYSSWVTMAAEGPATADECAYNDLALVRLDPRDVARVNPTVPYFGGPTGIVDAVPDGASVYSYGNSSLRLGFSTLSPKQGVAIGTSGGGWSHTVYTATPGIPGDSGSGFLDGAGRAFGVLSTVALAPLTGSNGVGDLARELAYLARHTDLDVTLALGTEPFTPGLPLDLGGSGGSGGSGSDTGGSGSDTSTVAVTRVSGADRYGTADAAAAGWETADTVFVATGAGFADALAAGPAAAVVGAPLLLAAPDGLRQGTLAQIRRLGATHAVIVGGTSAVPARVDQQLREAGVTPERIAGADRYATAVAVAQRFFVAGTPVAVVSGTGFADALAAAPLAAADSGPLVLVDRDALPAPTASLLRSWDPPAVTIVGGPAAVSAATADAVGRAAGVSPDRLQGSDRYATAAAVAATLLDDDAYGFAGSVWAASGAGFADALAGGPAAFHERGLLVLVPPTGDLPAAVHDVLARSRGDRLRVLGGRSAVSDAMAGQARDAMAS